MVDNDKSIKCTKFCKIDQNVDYVSMWCGRWIRPVTWGGGWGWMVGVGVGGQSAHPETSDQEISADLPGKWGT